MFAGMSGQEKLEMHGPADKGLGWDIYAREQNNPNETKAR